MLLEVRYVLEMEFVTNVDSVRVGTPVSLARRVNAPLIIVHTRMEKYVQVSSNSVW